MGVRLGPLLATGDSLLPLQSLLAGGLLGLLESHEGEAAAVIDEPRPLAVFLAQDVPSTPDDLNRPADNVFHPHNQSS